MRTQKLLNFRAGKKLTKREAFSLIEMMITLTIFATVAMVAVFALNNSLKSTRKIQSQVFLYSEVQAAMDRISRYVETNGIDYEAYYEYEALGNIDEAFYTPDYGQYGQAFFHPGDDGPTDSYAFGDDGVSGYDAYCSDGSSTYPDDCPTDLPVFDDLDQDTGAHPFTDISDFTSSVTDDPSYWNAFCTESSDCDSEHDNYITNLLLLISADGDERVIITREDIGSQTGEYRLSLMRMLGTDSSLDGIVDDWECHSDYDCTDTYTTDGGETLAMPLVDDLEERDSPQEDFMPFTPSSINFDEFYVIVAPIEDPYRAFAEEDIQIQPHVTIVLTASLSEDYSGNLLGDPPTITIQRTISTGSYQDVNSYE